MVGFDVLARQRFEETRRAVKRLDDIQWMIMNNCEEWKPPTVGTRPGTSDPTARQAIYTVETLAGKLEQLHREEHELIAFIGQSLVLIESVRRGLGERYAYLLEARYIDLLDWPTITADSGIVRQNGNYSIHVAFDWMDSIGEARLARGQFDI